MRSWGGPPMLDTPESILRDDAERLRDAILFGGTCPPLTGIAFAPRRPRSPRWRAIREAHLLGHPACSACGRDRSVEVHHLKPFHLRPELELDPANLLTLCSSGPAGANCHLLVGHAGDWSGWNEHAIRDARRILTMLRARAKGVD